eukprot:TRINITY_DN243_c0_g1_i1.p2 TRINITY_DN243_c0_g1~~TRINITY_DN243_c0_g1_i1.p2  ORF type:complete len:213 (-),score=37.21 TRINITY_DN243_c0_g1_i1:41-679(-)
MSKRRAETQITKDKPGDDETEEPTPSGEMPKADEATLAARKIVRAKRTTTTLTNNPFASLAIPPTTAPTPAPAPVAAPATAPAAEKPAEDAKKPAEDSKEAAAAPAPAAADTSCWSKFTAVDSSQWECSLCNTKNEQAAVACIACETAKPGAPAPTPAFTFGGAAPAPTSGTGGSTGGFTFGFGASSSSSGPFAFTFGGVAPAPSESASGAQ